MKHYQLKLNAPTQLAECKEALQAVKGPGPWSYFFVLAFYLFTLQQGMKYFSHSRSRPLFTTLKITLAEKVANPRRPIDSPENSFAHYRFFRAKGFLSQLDPLRINELVKSEVQRLILESVALNLRPRLEKYLGHVLEMSQKYQLDPFWALAVMWTESHFESEATSLSNATGLMQIMPDTGAYLGKLMLEQERIKSRDVFHFSSDPMANIEMGIFYLKALLEKFSGSHKFATISYNMGPNWVRHRLRNKKPVGVKNDYWDKVRRHYQILSENFIENLERVTKPYLATYVVQRNPVNLTSEALAFLIDFADLRAVEEIQLAMLL